MRGHGSEVPYVFLKNDMLRGEDLQLAETMATAWYDFAKTGSPGAAWPRYDKGKDGPYVTLDVTDADALERR